MRTRILILLLIGVLLTSLAYAFYINGSWEETRCELCGKRIYYWTERSSFDRDSMVYNARAICLGEEQTVLCYKFELVLCKDCYQEHEKQSLNMLRDYGSKLLEIMKNDHKSIRKKNEELIEQEDLKKIDEAIEKLKEKKQEIKGG